MAMLYGSIPQEQQHAVAASQRSKKPFLFGGVPRLAALLAVMTTAALVFLFGNGISQETDDKVGQIQVETPLLADSKSSLSQRGSGIKPVRDDIAMFMAGAADPYDPVANSDGYLVMLVAENKLMWKEMAYKIEQVQANYPLPEWSFTYGDSLGQVDFAKAMANVFSKWIDAPVESQYVKTQAGAGSVLAQLSYLLVDEGDAVLVTAPNYPAFAGDFGIYGGAHLFTVPTAPSTGFVPTVDDLEAVYAEAVAAGNPPRIFIICQPNNPTGTMYSEEAMHLMVTWALGKGLHVVSDEIYALSVFPGSHTPSAADVMRTLHPDTDLYLGDHVHVVAGLSKDWGMSGFRVGTLFSHNADLLTALELIGYYPSVSEYTQQALTHVFTDDTWMDHYIAENQQRLWETYQAVVAALDRIQVPVVPAQGALFAWADFSAYVLPNQTEEELWTELFTDAKILFTLGASCGESQPGMFRVVYPWPEGGPLAMKELGNRLVAWKHSREANARLL